MTVTGFKFKQQWKSDALHTNMLAVAFFIFYAHVLAESAVYNLLNLGPLYFSIICSYSYASQDVKPTQHQSNRYTFVMLACISNETWQSAVFSCRFHTCSTSSKSKMACILTHYKNLFSLDEWMHVSGINSPFQVWYQYTHVSATRMLPQNSGCHVSILCISYWCS